MLRPFLHNLNEGDQMNDIDKELKEIQLQREKLALERDISRKATKDRINKAANSLFAAACYLKKPVTGVFLRSARYWKPVSLAALLCTGGLAGYNWWEGVKQEQYAAARDAFAEEKCKSLASSYCQKIKNNHNDDDSVHDRFLCMQKSYEHSSCKMQAGNEFDKSNNK